MGPLLLSPFGGPISEVLLYLYYHGYVENYINLQLNIRSAILDFTHNAMTTPLGRAYLKTL